MNKPAEKKLDRKTLAAAVIFALLLILAAFFQLNIPQDRSRVPGNYNGNILLVIDQLAEKAWEGNSEATELVQMTCRETGALEAAALWNNFTAGEKAR